MPHYKNEIEILIPSYHNLSKNVKTFDLFQELIKIQKERIFEPVNEDHHPDMCINPQILTALTKYINETKIKGENVSKITAKEAEVAQFISEYKDRIILLSFLLISGILKGTVAFYDFFPENTDVNNILDNLMGVSKNGIVESENSIKDIKDRIQVADEDALPYLEKNLKQEEDKLSEKKYYIYFYELGFNIIKYTNQLKKDNKYNVIEFLQKILNGVGQPLKEKDFNKFVGNAEKITDPLVELGKKFGETIKQKGEEQP